MITGLMPPMPGWLIAIICVCFWVIGALMVYAVIAGGCRYDKECEDENQDVSAADVVAAVDELHVS